MKVTADDIARLLARPPPRQVPLHVAKATRGSGITWFLPVFGLIFGGMGVIFVVVFFPWRFWDDWQLASGDAQSTHGIITNVIWTNLTLNKRRVMEYGFNYTATDQQSRQGRCFTTGQQWSVNSPVTVHYLPDR